MGGIPLESFPSVSAGEIVSAVGDQDSLRSWGRAGMVGDGAWEPLGEEHGGDGRARSPSEERI